MTPTDDVEFRIVPPRLGDDVKRAADIIARAVVREAMENEDSVIVRLTLADPDSSFRKRVAARMVQMVSIQFAESVDREELRLYLRSKADTYISEGLSLWGDEDE